MENKHGIKAYKVINVLPYGYKFKAYIGDVHKIAKKYKIDIHENTSAFMGYNPNNKACYKRIVVLPVEVNISTIVHECTHLVNSMLNYAGYELDFDNDEHYCYLLGYITQQVFNLYK